MHLFSLIVITGFLGYDPLHVFVAPDRPSGAKTKPKLEPWQPEVFGGVTHVQSKTNLLRPTNVPFIVKDTQK